MTYSVSEILVIYLYSNGEEGAFRGVVIQEHVVLFHSGWISMHQFEPKYLHYDISLIHLWANVGSVNRFFAICGPEVLSYQIHFRCYVWARIFMVKIIFTGCFYSVGTWKLSWQKGCLGISVFCNTRYNEHGFGNFNHKINCSCDYFGRFHISFWYGYIFNFF